MRGERGNIMKRGFVWGAILLCLILAGFPALAADQPPVLPADMLPARVLHLPGGQRYKVYQGPGEEYGQAGKGKAKVSTNDWIQFFGCEDTWVMVQYGLGEGRMRIGWISAYDLPDDFELPDTLHWTWGRCHPTRSIALTDDPFGAQTSIETLSEGTSLILLADLGEWSYVETEDGGKIRGFVPREALAWDPIPYQTDENLVSIVQVLMDAGIEAEITGLQNGPFQQRTLYFSLANGGTARGYYFTAWGYDPYDLRQWDFENISNEDAEKYLDYYLSLAAEVENGRVAEEYLQPDYHGDLGQRNIKATVSTVLYSLESLGKQALDILMEQLSRHDGQDEINSLRARLASRLLGNLDATPVDAAQGCAWYDALRLARQDDLPPVNAALYVEDPLLCQATQLMIAQEEERKADWYNWDLDVDGEKARTVVSLHVAKKQESSDWAVLWAVEEETTFALYDGTRLVELGGSYIPCRITLEKDAAGTWTLREALYAEDGDLYAPSIMRFSDNDRELADRLMRESTYDTFACFQKYLAANGYQLPQIE